MTGQQWLNNAIKTIISIIVAFLIALSVGAFVTNVVFYRTGLEFMGLIVGIVLFLWIGYKILPFDVKMAILNWTKPKEETRTEQEKMYTQDQVNRMIRKEYLDTAIEIFDYINPYLFANEKYQEILRKLMIENPKMNRFVMLDDAKNEFFRLKSKKDKK